MGTNQGVTTIAAKRHFLTLLAALCWLVQTGGKPSATFAQDKLPAAAQDGAEQPVAYCFDVALPITDAVEKSVTRRVEQAIAKLPKTGHAAHFRIRVSAGERHGGRGEQLWRRARPGAIHFGRSAGPGEGENGGLAAARR